MESSAESATEGRPLPDDPPLLQQLMAQHDGQGLEAFAVLSTREAARFRRGLLTPFQSESANAAHPKFAFKSPAEAVAAATVEFRQREAELLGKRKLLREDSAQSAKVGEIDWRPSLVNFQLTTAELIDSIAGHRQLVDPKSVYGSFTGRWFGLWETNEVDHHWGPYQELASPLRVQLIPETQLVPSKQLVPAKPSASTQLDSIAPAASSQQPEVVRLLGYQYAWVGDGYGLNHVAQAEDGKSNFLLGYVVHVNHENLELETARRPHVGVAVSSNRLIWITKSEVFFEEYLPTEQPEYLITGFRYELGKQSLKVTSGFQAVYGRNPNQRVPWRAIPIEFELPLMAE